MATTTMAMRELLERKGITPTGDAKQDMVLAKTVMPAGYKRLDNKGEIAELNRKLKMKGVN